MKNHTDQDSKKQRILDATLDLIDEYGFEGITTRKIADRANVNVALINYYFGTKDALINQVVKIILSSLKEPFAHLEDRNLQPRERLKQFFLAYLKIYHMYPSIITLLLQKDRIQFESQKEYMNFVQALGIKA